MVKAFGIIPLREGKTLLVKHQKGHWAFPKGHPNPGEIPKETAKRELQEETGLFVVRFLGKKFHEHYSFGTTDKSVTYFLAEVAGELVLQKEEIADGRWMSFEEAASLATFDACKQICKELIK